ncbi:MAG: hypothetical protein ACJ78Q_19775 [Chloroflexia bacterium]
MILNLVLAFAVGVVTLVGFFTRGVLSDVAGTLAQWVSVLVAFALLLGLVNVLRVHIGRMAHRGEGWPYSVLLVGSALAVLLVGLASGGPGSDPVAWTFRWVYQPLGAAVFSLLAFFVTTALFRALRVRSAEAVVLLVAALIVIVAQVGESFGGQTFGFMADVAKWISDYPVLAGMRAVILGVAFGAIGISLRILLGFDRPYME